MATTTTDPVITPELLERLRHGPVPIERDGETVAVLVSAEEHAALELAREERETDELFNRALADPKALAWLRAEVQKGLDSIDAGRTVDAEETFARLEAKYRKMAEER